MTIESEWTGKNAVVMTLSGRLDTASAPQLERKVRQWGDEINELTLDFSNLTYLSSMGIRVLLQSQRALNAAGAKLLFKNVSGAVREVFEMTGLVKLFLQEEKLAIIRKEEGDRIRLSLIGRIDGASIPLLPAEMDRLKESSGSGEKICPVVLDLGQVTALTAPGCRVLGEILKESAFEQRKLTLENAAPEFLGVLQNGGLGDLLA
jgi:anti-sigma B factor antagonist